MASPYTSVTVTGYNANPPADDGSATAANTIFWATIKTKLNDTLKTAIEAINTNNVAAFAKVLGGAGVTSTAVDYQVLGSDQGKLVRATASAVTITTPDATSVLSPFVFAVLNNSSGTITLDGSGSQTIDGSANLTIPAGGGTVLFTDGTNWFTTGIQGTLVGKQLMAGDIINGTITESNGSNAVTFSLKTLAGNDPSAADPVLLCFRNTTAGTGNYVYRTVTAALTLVISSGSTMGFASGIAAKLWIVLFDDGGTIRMGAINCVTGGATPTNIYPLGQNPIASSTAEGGAGAADSAGVFYTGTAVSSKPYVILASASYESGIATAGAWNASPTRLRLFTHGSPLPGATIQVATNTDGALATGTTTIPYDDTIPQITEGTEFMTQAITPTSAAHLLWVDVLMMLAPGNNAVSVTAALFRDATASALAVSHDPTGVQEPQPVAISHSVLAGATTATTFRARAGGNSATTMNFNGNGAARKFGGVMGSRMAVREIMT